MEELNITERIFGVLMFSWYLFAPEIAEIKKGKFTKTIVITLLSTLLAIHLDVQYFIINYPQRAVAIILFGIITAVAYAKQSNVLKNIAIEKKIKKIKKSISIYYNRVLNWIYFSGSDQYIYEIERKSFSFGWNNFRVLILSILIFDHFILKFSRYSFAVIFLSTLTLHSLLLFSRIITKYPIRIFLGTILLPWLLFFPVGFICNYSGIQAPLLEDRYLVWYFGLDTSDWVGATLKFCIFFSIYLFISLILFAIISICVRFIFKVLIKIIKSLLVKIPIFSRQKKKEKIRHLNLQI
jgi:hypothetical protein